MSIPASRIVTINPEVISAGGNPLVLNGLYLTQNTAMPVGKVFNFTSVAAVAAFFGAGSAEAAQASIYFAGYVNSSVKPTGILFTTFNLAAREAFLHGGSLAGLSLTQLQALTGTVILTVDGTLETSASISLAGATSFSNAASLIQAGFTTPPFTVAYDPITSAFVFTATGSAGPSSTISFATGTISIALALTAPTGAFTSQGAAADTPASAMNNATAISQNWASFVTMWEPTLTDKEAFAVWSNGQNNRYLYLAWDSDVQASTQGSTTAFGVVALAAEYNGVMCLSGDPASAVAEGTTLAILALALASFVSGAIASVNFSQPNGRVTAAFLKSGSIQSTCGSDPIAENLLANGYSFYGTYASANQGFIFLYNGQLPGVWLWMDSYINQIYLNSQFQIALMTLLTSLVGSVPYTPSGYSLIRAALQSPIDAALSFGSIRTGVELSAAQAVAVNLASGVNAAPIIETQGYYLQVLDPGAQARANRATPIINFWYADGGAVQQITMASIDIL